MFRIHGIVSADHIRIPGELSNEAGNDEEAGRHHVPLVGSVPARLVLDREEGIQLGVRRTKQTDKEEDEEDVRHHVLLDEADHYDNEQKQLREVVVQEESDERPTVHLVVLVLRLLLGIFGFRLLLFRALLLPMKRTQWRNVKIRNASDRDHDTDKETDQVAEDVAARHRLRYESESRSAVNGYPPPRRDPARSTTRG